MTTVKAKECTMRNCTVLIACPRRGDRRVFQIAANSLLAANELAAAVVARLSPEALESISVDVSGHGAHVEPVQIVDVYEDVCEFLDIHGAGWN